MQNNDALTKYLSNRRIENATRLQDFALKRQQKEVEQQQKKIEAEEQARSQREAEEQAKIDDAGFFEKLGYTIADVFTELGGGLAKLVEGVADIGLTLVGGTFWAPDIIKFDATQEWWYSWEDKITEKSYMNDAPIVKDIVRGIGQQLPTIAAVVAAPFTGGATLAALPYTIGATVASAGGQGAEESLNEGASGGEALLYGLLQSGIEGAVEFATAGMGKGLTSVGKAVGKNVGKTVAKSAGKIMLEEALSETVEEGISALVNPLTKTIYKGGEALEAYKNPEFYGDVAKQALVGGVVGGISGGAGAISQVKLAGGKSNYKVQQSAQEINTLDTKEDNLWKNGKLTTEQESKIEAARQVELNNISKQLKGMEASSRTEAIKKFNLSNHFTAEGDIVASSTQDTLVDSNSATAPNVARKPLISDNKEAYSPSLRNTELKLAPTSEVLTEAGQSAKNIISKLGGKSRIVVTDVGTYNGNAFDAFYDNDSKTIYVNNNANAETVRTRVAVHEVTHTLEGTKQYAKLEKYIQEHVVKEITQADGTKKTMTFVDLVAEVEKNYSKTVTGKSDAAKLYTYKTEVTADLMGELLSSEQSISRLVDSQKSIAYRIYSWAKSAVARLTNKGDTTSADYRFIRKVERLYANAMRKSVGGISLDDVERRFEELSKKQEVEDYEGIKRTKNKKGEDIRYSAKKTFAEQVDEVIEGTHFAEYDLYVSETPKILLDIGLPDKPLLMRNSKIKEILEKHNEMSVDLIKAIPEAIKDPIMVIKSKTNPNDSVVLITQITTSKGEMIVPVWVNQDGTYLDVMLDKSIRTDTNFVASAYGRNTKVLLEYALQNNEVLFYNSDKEKVRRLLATHGLQLPARLSTSDFKGSETLSPSAQSAQGGKSTTSETLRSTRSTSTNSIHETTKNVNPDNKKSGERYSISDKGNIDKNDEVRYNRNKKLSYIQWRSDALAWANDPRTKVGDMKVGADGNSYYIYEAVDVESEGKPNDYSIVAKIDINNQALYDYYEEFIDENNRRLDRETSRVLRAVERIENGQTSNDSYSNDVARRQSNNKNGSIYQRESESDGERNTKKSGGDKSRYSLKDSQGNTLSKEQQEFFKDTKVIDSSGNLFTVYHGTNKDFTIFDINKLGANTGLFTEGVGFYFTNNEDMADLYTSGTNKKHKVYLNITKPMLVNQNKFTKDIRKKIFLELYKIDSNALSNYADVDYEGVNVAVKAALEIESSCETDLDFIASLVNGGATKSQTILNTVTKITGYDGVINNGITTSTKKDYKVFVAFNPNQIKLTSNQNPTTNEDIRFSLKNGEGSYQYSKGQIARYVAEHSKTKAYTRTDAEQIVNTLVSNQLSFGDKYGEISGKTQTQVVDMLWHALNTKDEGYRGSAALDIAEFIINNTVMESIYADEVNEADSYIVNTLRQYLHSVDLSGIKGEIAHRYDKDNSPYLLWGKRKGTRASAPDQIAMELEESGIRFNATNEADIFFEMDDLYRSAIKSMKKAAKDKLANIAAKEDLAQLKQSLAREILLSYDTTGHQTKFALTIEKYTNKISELKAAIRDIKAGNKAKNNVVSTIERMRDEFVKHKPAGWEIPQQVAYFVKKIAKVETWRNNISKTARESLKELGAQIDAVLDDTQKAIYPFKDTIVALAMGEGDLSTAELQQLDEVLRSFIHQLRNYDKVIFGGKQQSISENAENAVIESKQAKTILKYGGKILIRFKNYVYENPYDRLAEMGLYRKDSVAMRMYADILEGDRRRAKFAYDTNNLFEAFFKANKKYLNELHGNITIGVGASAVTLTKGQLMSIYSTSLREQGRGHLFNESDSVGVIRVLDDTLAKKGKMKEAFAKGRDVEITSAMIAKFKDSLTSADNEFLQLTNKFFNEMSRDAKRTTDEQIYGITNLEEGHYFPIHVSNDKIYTEAGQNNNNVNQFILSMGMNKATVPNAKNKIVIDDIFSVLLNHERDMSLYYGFAVPLVAYNRIMNMQVDVKDGNLDATVNMRSELNKIDPYFEGYMDRLWQDVQGITSREKSMFSKAMDYLRWAGANSALGLNPKVLVTQMLSLASATAEFNPKYITKGMGHFFGKKQKIELSKYSPLMWERMQIGNSVEIEDVRKVNSKFGKVGSFIGNITKPITFMDSNVISSLWFAAQYEIADTMGDGYEFGTEENKIEAGKRLDEVVFRTQQTTDKLGRSEYMRSQNEMVKFVRMFTGDIVQLVGRMIASVNKVRIAHKMIKSSDMGLSKQGSAMLSEARKGVAKASGAFLLNQVMLLAIAMAFKWIKGKKDDEDWGEVAQKEALANLFGLIPLGGDIFDKLQGYEPTNMAYTALSNTVDIATDLYGGIAALVSGDYVNETELRGKLRKSALAISRLTGIPLQNLESYLMGVVGKASPATKEEYYALFKTKSNKVYLDKLSKALENDDEALADTIVNLMFDSKTGRIKDDKVMETTRDLLELGYDVLPKSLSDEITYNGEKINLTSRQHAVFKKIYSEANDKVKTMVNSSMFARLEDGAKAKAFKTVYDFYFNLGLEDLLGEDLENKNILFSAAIPIEQLAMAVAQSQQFEADLDKTGNAVSGSKKIKVQNFVKSLNLSAVQKYIVMGYLGYTNANGAAPVKAYINGLKLSKTQKETLYEMSGYKLEKKRAG